MAATGARPAAGREADGIDAGRMLADARELAFPRYPGTPGDRRAIALVATKLREAGLDVREEEFSYDVRPAFRALRVALVSSAALVAACAVVASPWGATLLPAVDETARAGAALVLLALGVVPGLVLLAWAPGTERLYARPGPTRTANVIGRRPVAEPRRTLILMAHHDSKSQNLTLPVRLGATILALLGAAGLAALVLTVLWRGSAPGSAWWPVAAGGVAAGALLVLSTLRSEDGSPGGVDNAGSVAVVLELARDLPRRVPDDVELIFLSTGAEEDHMVGAMRWLDTHREALRGRPVHALNFDGAGSPGRAVVIERFGFGKAFSPELSRAARAAAGRLGIPLRGIWLPPAIGVDAIPFAHRGIDSLTFSSGALGRATLAVHSPNDVAAHLDPETLARVARLGRAVAVELAGRPNI